MSDRGVAVQHLAEVSAADGTCAGCGARTRPEITLSGHPVMRCVACGLYVLQVMPERHDALQLDRTQFEGGLRELRLANYATIVSRLGQLAPLAGRSLLDVGCSMGWFLEVASRAGCVCHGIEPDEFFFDRIPRAALPNVRVVHGYFARDLPAEWGPFDVITFHDVFEHLPEPEMILRACRERLAPGGCVVLSLPSADGFVFHLAHWLAKLGVSGPLARMFQVHYPFPHLFYFTRHSIGALARRCGFDAVLVDRLRSFTTRGALGRARMDRSAGPLGVVRAYASAAALLLFAAIEPLLPADNMLVVLRPNHL